MTSIQPLQIVGSSDAAVCEGDFCEIPGQVVNRALDADRV